jgi:hypothetical protein
LPQGVCADAVEIASAPTTIVAQQARTSLVLCRQNMVV